MPSQSTMRLRLADAIIRWRHFWAVVALGIFIVASLGAARLQFDPDMRVFFDETNAERIALDKFEAAFAKDDNLIMAISDPKGETVFTPSTLAAVGALTEKAWLLPYVRRVNSLTNFQDTHADGDAMIVRDLVPDPKAVTAEIAAHARARAMSRPEVVNLLVGKTEKMTQVSVLFRLPGVDPKVENPKVVEAVEVLAAEFRAAYPELRLDLSGSVIINHQFAVAGQADGKTLSPLMFAAILLIVGWSLRSGLAVLMTMVVIIISAVASFGVLGWAGIDLNTATVLGPLIVMTLAVSSCVHMLSSVRQKMTEGGTRTDWVRAALTQHMLGITIACVTTAVGFLSLNASISPPFRQLGNMVATGVLVALLLTLTLLPAMIIWAPLKQHAEQAWTRRVMLRLGDWVIRNWRMMLPLNLLLLVGLGAGISRIQLEDNFIQYFDETTPFRIQTDHIEQNLTGLNMLIWALPSGSEGGINEPDYLKRVDDFVQWLRLQPGVSNASALTETIKRLNMNMHGDDPSWQRIPDNAEEAAQYLFLYELSLGYGMDLTDQINVDRSALRVNASLPGASTADMRLLTERATAWLAQHAPAQKVDPTGLSHVFNLISFRDTRAMLTGTIIALILISGLMFLVLRDWRLGLISLLPNLVPAAMAFGVWGYLVGNVTLAISIVVAATLGIVVDDTVHFLVQYKEARRRGETVEQAIRSTFAHVGMSIIVTSVGFILGFAILAQSGFAPNADMAKLTAMTLCFALMTDLLMLPALLIWLDKRTSPMTKAAPVVAALSAMLLLIPADPARAEDMAAKGRAIAEETARRDSGWVDSQIRGTMILRDPSGSESRRSFRITTLEGTAPGEGDKSIIVFEQPADVRGVAMLTHAKIEPQDDDQWLYLPAVKRVKRIASSNRTGKFVSSEFSFEDLGSQEVEDYTYLYLREEACPTDPALRCAVVESAPKSDKSGYSKRIVWTDLQEYRPQHIAFYNRRGDLEKELSFSGYKRHDARFWRADKLVMTNKQTGKSTEMQWEDYRFGTGVSADEFNEQRLPTLVD